MYSTSSASSVIACPGDSSSSTMSMNGAVATIVRRYFSAFNRRVLRIAHPIRIDLSVILWKRRLQADGPVGKRANQIGQKRNGVAWLDRQCRPHQTNAIDLDIGRPGGIVQIDERHRLGSGGSDRACAKSEILNDVPDQLDPCVLAEITKRAGPFGIASQTHREDENKAQR